MVAAGISPDYFLDRMAWYELEPCLEGIEHSRRASWEQTRSIVLAVVNAAGGKMKTSDFALPWDKEGELDESNEVNLDEIKNLREYCRQQNARNT